MEHSFRDYNLGTEQIRVLMFCKEPGFIAQGLEVFWRRKTCTLVTFVRLTRIIINILALTICFRYLFYTQRSVCRRSKYPEQSEKCNWLHDVKHWNVLKKLRGLSFHIENMATFKCKEQSLVEKLFPCLFIIWGVGLPADGWIL